MEDWKTNHEPEYFDLLEFVDKIKISDKNLEHLNELNENFEKYLNVLGKYADYDSFTMIYYWLDQTHKEHMSSNKIERHKFVFSNKELINGNLFFDNLNISDKRIKNIHQFVCNHSDTNIITTENYGDYRKEPCWVGVYDKDGNPDIFWYGSEVDSIEKFMKSYMDFYKKNSLREIYSNPFLKSALAHLLFVRIHPFADGNGRTARIIQNISFTSNINKIYGTNLKLSPLNISSNIHLNQPTYADRINRVRFDLEHNNDESINDWFEFILNMYDEQLYYQTNRIPKLKKNFTEIKNMPERGNSVVATQAEKSKIKKLF